MGRLSILITFFISLINSAALIQCQDLFQIATKKSQTKQSLSFQEEEKNFLQTYYQFVRSKAPETQSLITPENRIVFLLDPRSKNQYQGRILDAFINERGRPELLFLELQEDGQYSNKPIRVPFVGLGFVQLRVKYSDKEIEERTRALMEANDHQNYFTFKHRFLGRNLTGKVLSLETDFNGNVTSFVFENSNFERRSYDLQSIESIKSIQSGKNPEELTLSKQALISRSQEAIDHQLYVEVVLEGKKAGAMIEGWIVKISTNANGEYFIHVDPQSSSVSNRTFAISLNKIKQINRRERIQVRYPDDPQDSNLLTSSITMKSVGLSNSAEFTKALTEFKFYLREINSSGPQMPRFLRNNLASGEEIRFYFSSEKGTMRLIIRRAAKGSWTLGLSEVMPLLNDELVQKYEQQVTYSPMEQATMQLKQVLPAYYLRQYLRQIKSSLSVPQQKKSAQNLIK